MMKMLFLAVFLPVCSVAHCQPIPKMKMAEVVDHFTRDNDTVYVVNFWATFCRPCVGEIPYFISLVKKYEKQKVKLLLVSLDLPSYYPARIRAFAAQRRFNVPLAWLDETNADVFCPMIDPRWSGAIPATLIVNHKTGYRKFFEDEMKASEFERELQLAIARPGASISVKDHSIEIFNEPQ
jgi:thiol-disulfide isomerase/thioredoxin